MTRPSAGKSIIGRLSPDLWVVIACVAVYCIANLTGWLVPQVVHGAMQKYNASAGQAGLLPTTEGLVTGLLSMALAGRAVRFGYRALALSALALWLSVNIGSYFAPSFTVLLGFRFLSGTAGAMMIFTSAALAASTRNPDRTYGVMNVVSNGYSAIAIALWPALAPHASSLTYLPFAAVFGLIWLPLFLALPSTSPAQTAEAYGQEAPPAFRVSGLFLALMASMIIIAFQSFSNFTFSFGFGLKAGLAESQINLALGAASLISGLGALSAGFVAPRFGRFAPMIVVLGLSLAANYLLTQTKDPIAFRVTLILSLTSMFFLLSLFLGWAAALDRTGGGGGLMMGAFVVTSAVAPTLSGKLVDAMSLAVLGPSTIVTGILGIVLLCGVRLASRRGAIDAPVGGLDRLAPQAGPTPRPVFAEGQAQTTTKEG